MSITIDKNKYNILIAQIAAPIYAQLLMEWKHNTLEWPPEDEAETLREMAVIEAKLLYAKAREI